MATAAKTVYSHITKDPGVRGGKACVDDTRIPVVALVARLKDGRTAEQMLAAHPDLSPAQVHAVLAYYHDRRDEIGSDVLRHSYATHLLLGGASIREIQALLGHKDVGSTALYTKVDTRGLFATLDRCHPRERAQRGR